MNEPQDTQAYDRWLESRRESAVPDGFAGRVMATVTASTAQGARHPEGWIARLGSSRSGLAMMAAAAGLALLARLLSVASRFVD